MYFSKKLKKYWRDRQSARAIKNYYLNERIGPAGEHWALFVLLAGAAIVYVFLQAVNFREVLGYSLLICMAFIAASILARKIELQELKAKCIERLGDGEFKRRLDKAYPGEVLGIIGQVLGQRFGLEEIKTTKEGLVGIYRGAKMAVYYRHLEEEEVMDTKNVMTILRNCRQQGIKQVRIFTNTDFSPKAPYLGERYEMNIVLYDGLRLKILLRETSLYPSPDEISNLIKKDSEKRHRKLSIIKKQAIRQGKTGSYLVYGGMLLSMAWFKLGYFYLNLFFAVLLFLLAGISLLRKLQKKEEEIVFE